MIDDVHTLHVGLKRIMILGTIIFRSKFRIFFSFFSFLQHLAF